MKSYNGWKIGDLVNHISDYDGGRITRFFKISGQTFVELQLDGDGEFVEISACMLDIVN